jgi:penicillin-insensitive murein endopeptidase
VLTEAVELKESGPGFVRYRPQGAYYWGTSELVSLVEQAAASVDQAFGGGPPLVVGDLSGKRGGRIERHQSHRTGRDVDLLFYVTTPAGVPVRTPGFVKFGRDGLAGVEPLREFVRFDVPRNWSLVKALVSSGTAPVQRIYVCRALEALLIDYALARVEDLTLVWRAQSVLAEPGDSTPHDDHFHLRVACTPERQVAGCGGGGPLWEWLPNPWQLFSPEVASEDWAYPSDADAWSRSGGLPYFPGSA